jgi:hypothetical protein
MAKGFGFAAALAMAMVLLCGTVAAAARHAPDPINKAHERLLQMSPPDRAAMLARAVGHWCVGTETFPMGVVTRGPGEGNAYWSLRCTDGTAWAVQIDPFAEVTAIDCASFKEAGQGKECFKKF